MGEIDELKAKIIKFRDERNWEQFHNAKDLAISLSLEASEVLEHFQWKNQREAEEHIENHKDELADELADVMIYLILLSHETGIDLLSATEKS